MEFLKSQFKIMKERNIVFVSKDLYIDAIKDGKIKKKLCKGEYPTDKDYKQGWNASIIDYNKNGCIIPIGERYNLFVVDVDLYKGDTKNIWFNYVEDNEININTFTMKTINKGYHYYYKLKDDQITKLKEINFNSKNCGKFLDSDIDLLYNMFSIGSSAINHDDSIYKYKISNNEDVAYMPKRLFNDIYKCLSSNNKPIKKVINNTTDDEPASTNYSKDIFKLYLDPLDKLTDRNDWLKIGSWINYKGGNMNDYDLFSKQYDKYYDYKGLKKAWYDIQKNNYKGDIKEILLKFISYQEYEKIEKRDTDKILDIIINNPLQVNDKMISSLYYSLYPNECVFDQTSNKWYTINKYGIYDCSDDDNYIIKERINSHIYNLLIDTIETAIKKKAKYIEENEEDEKKNKAMVNYKKVKDKVITYFGKYDSKPKIIKELKGHYGLKSTLDLFNNKNPYIFGFNNGVYDFKNDCFRNATPDEYISITCDYDYKPLNKIPKDKINKMNDILISIFPDDDERDYVLSTIATGLIGVNSLEEFYIWIGVGSNGKGVLSTYIQKMLGAYYDTMNIDYLCKDNSNSKQADPEMAKKIYSRLCISSEPESNCKLQSGKLKLLSGGDSIQVRGLYEKSFSFVPKFKMIIQTNWTPEIDGSDNGMKRRIRLINFPNEFVDNPTMINHRKRDNRVKNDYPNDNEFLLALFHILKEKIITLMNNEFKLTMPKRFDIDTKRFIDSNAPIDMFIHDCIIKKEGSNIKSSDLFKMFNEYLNNMGIPCNINVKKFSEVMKNKSFDMYKNSVMYYRNIEYKPPKDD